MQESGFRPGPGGRTSVSDPEPVRFGGTSIESDPYTQSRDAGRSRLVRIAPPESPSRMNLFNCTLGRNVIAATLAVLMPLCCCVLKTAAAVVSDGPERIVPSCCASHCEDADSGTDRPADDCDDCEGCCVKAPVTVDHELDDAFDHIAFQPELTTMHAEAIHDLPGVDADAIERGEPPSGPDPARSARDLRRVVVLQR